MELYKVNQLDFSYPTGENLVLNGVNLVVESGDFLVICGQSGSGKSTLLRQLKPSLAVKGTSRGGISYKEQPLDQLSHVSESQEIGFVCQHPDQQLVTDKVWHELAFGLERLGLPQDIIRRRVAEMASFFGMEHWFHQDICQLSGGQKQRLNLASVLAMNPSVLILDEPTSQLDPITASEFFALLGKINRELGITIILTEHRLEEVLAMATQVAVMEQGVLIHQGDVKSVASKLKESGHGLFSAMPTPMQIWASVENDLDCPVTATQGRNWLEQVAKERELLPLVVTEVCEVSQPVLEGTDLHFRYDKHGSDVVKGFEFALRKGEIFAILGGNGAGKTTALKLLAGLEIPQRGKVKNLGRMALLPQNPQALFIGDTVLTDLESVGKGEKLVELITQCQLGDLLDRHPYDLSGGEQQCLALAKVLLTEPDILLLDEPTKGLDCQSKDQLGELLQQLCEQGVSVLMVSHDVEFSAQYTHRCGLFFDGSLVSQGTSRSFFSDNFCYTTVANRMAKIVEPQAVTKNDVVTILGGQLPKGQGKNDSEKSMKTSRPDVEKPPEKKGKSNLWFLLLLSLPATLWFGMNTIENYYLVAIMVLLQCMVPFFLAFEGRKPKAREVVVVATLCGLAVLGRTAFFMLPQVKPVLAIVIISGVALGGQTGFLVGALSMFASNMIFGQGPWTPFQMVAAGVIGLLAGWLFSRKKQPRIWAISFYGFVSTLVIYGGLLDPSYALYSGQSFSWQLVGTLYLSGLSMNLIHAVATALFLWFGGRPVLNKLNRVKVKYELQ